MLDLLNDFPLIRAPLTLTDPSSYGFETGELRLLALPSSVGATSVNCELHLLRFLKHKSWRRSQRFQQKTSGSAILTKVDATTFIVSGEAVAVLHFPQKESVAKEGGEIREARFTFKSDLRKALVFKGAWNIEVSVDIEDPEDPGAQLQRIHARGLARLYPKPRDLPALDFSKTMQGELFLPLIPVVLTSEAATSSFESWVSEAHKLWFENARVAIEDGPKLFVDVPKEIRDEARDGKPGRLETYLLQLDLAGIPVMLVDGFSSAETGKGQTASSTPLASWTIMAADPGKNTMLLAHEVGHILGGNDDGEKDEMRKRWCETEGEPSLMVPIGNLLEHPRVIGRIAREYAPRWALFRERPIGVRGKIESIVSKFL